MGNEIEPDCKFVHCMPTNVHSLKILNNICVSFVCMLVIEESINLHPEKVQPIKIQSKNLQFSNIQSINSQLMILVCSLTISVNVILEYVCISLTMFFF